MDFISFFFPFLLINAFTLNAFPLDYNFHNLHDACLRGDLEGAKHSLHQLPPILLDYHYKSIYQTPLLHNAIIGGNADIVELLLQSESAYVDILNEEGRNAFHLAAIHGNVEIGIKLLLQSVFETNEKDNYGETALHLAIRHGRVGFVKFLILSHSIDYGIADNQGLGVFHAAASSHRLEIMQSLVAQTAEFINQRDRTGATPLMKACAKGNFRVVSFLLQLPGVLIDTVDYNGMNILHHAACGNSLRTLKLILNLDLFDVNERSLYENFTPLHFAKLSQSVYSEGLLSKYSNINANVVQSYVEEVELFKAFHRSSLDFKATLVSMGKISTKSFSMLLHQLISRDGTENDIQKMLSLYSHSAILDVNVENAHGLSPLKLAMMLQKVTVFNMLIDTERVEKFPEAYYFLFLS